MDAVADWLRLVHAPGLGALTARQLRERFGDAAAIRGAPQSALRNAGLSAEAIACLHADEPGAGIAHDLQWAEADAARHLIALDDPRYPAAIAALDDPPPVLYVQGDPDVLQAAGLAMVGSRHPTPSGRETAHAFAEHLAAAGLVVASGLALGIDGAAHEGALAANGLTLAIAGTGLDRIYPARHADLARRIAAHGALVSELPIGTRPSRGAFPRRNRLLAALGIGTLVVEAAARSGSLITARLALEQGHEVFAIPGSIHNPVARGCHRLIREGAKLVETGADVLEELAPLLGPWAHPATDESSQSAAEPGTGPSDSTSRGNTDDQLLACLDWQPRGIDELTTASGLGAAAVASMLLRLEMDGRVQSLPGGLYQRP